MDELDHPQKSAIEALRRLVRGADRSIAEGIKWNSPSFRTSEYFATVNLRTKTPAGAAASPVALILHLGAKKRPGAKAEVSDPGGLLEWLGDDRAMLTFGGIGDVKRNGAAVKRIVQEWIQWVE